jgi:hypothetical protein
MIDRKHRLPVVQQCRIAMSERMNGMVIWQSSFDKRDFESVLQGSRGVRFSVTRARARPEGVIAKADVTCAALYCIPDTCR